MRRSTAILIALLAGVSFDVLGALAVSLHPDAVRGRSYALRGVLAEFTYDGASLLRGRLHVILREGRATRGTYVSDELALSAGTTTFRMFLPASHGYGGGATWAEAELVFVSDRKRYELGRQPFMLPDGTSRQLLIGTTRTATEADGASAELFKALRLEQFDPEREKHRYGGLRTLPVTIAPNRLPRQGLEYAAYDLVVMEGATFETMSERQLRALDIWLQAGGSAYVRVPRRPSPSQAAFFEGLGVTAPPDVSHAKPLRLRRGLGRVVLVPDTAPPDGHFQTAGWRTSCAFLWKLRHEQATAVAASGKWLSDREISEEEVGNNWQLQQVVSSRSRANRGSLPLGAQARSDSVQFFVGLIPVDFQPVPTWILATLLIGFVLVIGPVDYLLLGALRARRFTWVTFPVACVICTGLIALVANRYLASDSDLHSATVVDVAADGVVAREHRIDLTVPGRAGTLTREYARCLHAPVFGSAWGFGNFTAAEGAVERTIYRGAVPGRYEVDLPVAKWSPSLSRRLFFGRAPDSTYTVPRLPDPPDFDGGPEWQRRAREQFEARNAGGWQLWLLHDSNLVRISGDKDPLQRAWGSNPYFYSGNADTAVARVLGPLRLGYASVAAQGSPACDPMLDDFGIHDDSDPNALLWILRNSERRAPVIIRMLQRREGPDGTG